MCGANTNLDSTVGSYIEKLDKTNKEGREQDDEEGEEENRDCSGGFEPSSSELSKLEYGFELSSICAG
jgi:hypothetical protein